MRLAFHIMAETIFDGDKTKNGLPVARNMPDPVFIMNTSDNPIDVNATLDTTGLATSAKQDTQITDLGGVTETAPATDTASSGLNGRLQRIAQRLTSILASTLGFSVGAGTTDATTIRVITASDGPLNAVLGTTSGAAVTTDANGTIQQFLRGIATILGAVTASPVSNSIGDRLKALLTGIVLAAGTAIIGKVGIDQTTPGTTNAVAITRFTGAANFATGQITTSTTAATFVIARATRRSVTLKNTDAAIVVYFGPATVTSSNGFPLKAGESISVDWVGLIQVIAASATPVVTYADSYD